MKEIVDRLQEKHQIERAISIVESQGYVVKKSRPKRKDETNKPIKSESAPQKKEEVKEDQVPLPSNNPEAEKKVAVQPLSTLRPFTKEDYYGWAGATPLASGNGPFIWEDEDGDNVVIVASEDMNKDNITENTPAQMEIYFRSTPDDDEMLQAYTLKGAEKDVLSTADEIAKKLSQGIDLRKLAREYNLKFMKF